MLKIGSRAQVMHGNARMTGGGLRKKDLKYNKHGKIVSKKMSQRAKKEKRLQKVGYTTVKGQFGTINMNGGKIKCHQLDYSKNCPSRCMPSITCNRYVKKSSYEKKKERLVKCNKDEVVQNNNSPPLYVPPHLRGRKRISVFLIRPPNNQKNIFYIRMNDKKKKYYGDGFVYNKGDSLKAIGTSGLNGCTAILINISISDDKKIIWCSHIPSDINYSELKEIFDNIIIKINKLSNITISTSNLSNNITLFAHTDSNIMKTFTAFNNNDTRVDSQNIIQKYMINNSIVYKKIVGKTFFVLKNFCFAIYTDPNDSTIKYEYKNNWLININNNNNNKVKILLKK